MRVLITGAAGFVGSHLVDRYLQDGHSVVGVDNLCTGARENLAAARRSPAFSFAEADVAGDWSAISRTVHDIDLVLHLASPASPVDYEHLALETMAVNSLGTQRCCEFAQRHRARLLYASTSECYGDPLEHPQRETYWGNVHSTGPRACYDESKRYGEAYIATFVRKRGLDARIIRIFNTYGPRMRVDDGRVVPNFIGQALRGEPLTIYGDGLQTRSFCYVSDLVEGIVRVAAAPDEAGSITNLGNPQEHTIGEFARIVSGVAGVSLQTIPRDLPVDDPKQRCPDIGRARERFGWEPQIGLQDGLRITYNDFRERVKSVASR